MCEWWGSTQDVSEIRRYGDTRQWTQLLIDTVVPSRMNPVGEEGNLFSALFDRVPAKRAGIEDDIAGTILYIVSRAGVSLSSLVGGGSILSYGAGALLMPCLGVRGWNITLC